MKDKLRENVSLKKKPNKKTPAVYGNLSIAKQWQRFPLSWPWLDCFLSDTKGIARAAGESSDLWTCLHGVVGCYSFFPSPTLVLCQEDGEALLLVDLRLRRFLAAHRHWLCYLWSRATSPENFSAATYLQAQLWPGLASAPATYPS